MKKKLMSLVAGALALTMTTSAFAATPRGNGDVDNDGQITANDVMMILNNLATGEAANVDGQVGITGKDARIAYLEMLQPKTVTEDLELRVYTENYSIGATPVTPVTGTASLGSAAAVANDKGTGIVNDAVISGTSVTSVSTAIDSLAKLVTDTSAKKLSEQLDKIYFVSATKGDVYLRKADGWAMFCYAVQPIVPMEKDKAILINKTESTDAEIDAKKTQVEALKNIEALVVSDKELTAEDVNTIKTNFLIAFPNTITSDEVNETVKRVLEITGSKYVFKANDEEITADSSFVQKVAEFMPGYQDKTMADFRSTFGDKLEITAQNKSTGANPIKLVIEVAVVADVRGDEATTNAEATTVAEPTTTAVDTTTEATTAAVDTTTESTTEATTEAPVGGLAYIPSVAVAAGGVVLDNDKATITAGQDLTFQTNEEITIKEDGKVFADNVKTSSKNTYITIGDLSNKAYRVAFVVTAKKDMTFTAYVKTGAGKESHILSGNVILNSANGDPCTATSLQSIVNNEGSSVYNKMTITVNAGETIYLAGKGTDMVVYAMDVQ